MALNGRSREGAEVVRSVGVAQASLLGIKNLTQLHQKRVEINLDLFVAIRIFFLAW